MSPWAISQVADRIDGKATAEIQTERRHRYVIEAPAQLTREQWIAKYSPTPEVRLSGGIAMSLRRPNCARRAC